MSKRDRQRHKLLCFAAGVTKHESLIPCPDIKSVGVGAGLERVVNAHRNIRRLLVYRAYNSARIGVKAEFRTIVTDAAHGISHDRANIGVPFRGDLSHDEHESCCTGDLASHARHRILREKRIKHCVRDLVAYFIGMSLGNRFGSKQFFHYINILSLISKKQGLRQEARRPKVRKLLIYGI